jgi:hypothetical protein
MSETPSPLDLPAALTARGHYAAALALWNGRPLTSAGEPQPARPSEQDDGTDGGDQGGVGEG